MLELSIEKKGNSFVATTHHLPSATFVRISANTENKAIALCFSELLKKTALIDWLCIKLNAELVEIISLNNVVNFSVSGLSSIALDKIIDRTLGQFASHHVFSNEDGKYCSYSFEKGRNFNKFYEALLSVEGLVLELS